MSYNNYFTKQIFRCTFIFFVALLFAQNVYAEERIDSFQTNIIINSDASFRVEERIVYDFGGARRHGIYRDIPVVYKRNGGRYTLGLSDISVTDENGAAYTFELSAEENNKRIQIGRADILLTGAHTYIIRYSVNHAISYFADFDELYWNVTGNNWPVAIDSVSAAVILPKSISKDQLRISCYAGIYGSSHACDGKVVRTTRGAVNKIQFMQKSLQKNKGLTIAVGFPKGVVYEPSTAETYGMWVQDNWIVGVPFLTFAILFYLWFTRGRDPKGKGVVVPRYAPPDNFTPAEVGTVADEYAEDHDIAAEIIQLAVLGYIKITRLQEKKYFFFPSTDYLLEKLKNTKRLKQDYEQLLLNYLFTKKGKQVKNIRLSEHKDKFYKHIKKLKNKVYASVMRKGMFIKNPEKVRNYYRAVGLMVIIIGGIIGSLLESEISIFSIIISGVFIILFSFIMPARTKQGALIREHIFGFREYLSVAEKDRLEFHNGPEKNPELFEKYLPFAIALKVEKEWARQFEDIMHAPPKWYNDTTRSQFGFIYFTSGLSDFVRTSSTTITSTPQSSGSGGGGFSGGGFGGGGGGSW